MKAFVTFTYTRILDDLGNECLIVLRLILSLTYPFT